MWETGLKEKASEINLSGGSAVDYRYLEKMTDRTAIIQFAVQDQPDRKSGYTVDDNARALLVALKMEDEKGEELAKIYIRFLKDSFLPEGRWRNLKLGAKWLADLDSEDCQGRAFLACSIAAASDHEEISGLAFPMLEKTLPAVSRLQFPRAKAYALLGLINSISLFGRKGEQLAEMAGEHCENLIYLYNRCKGKGWYWFEDTITYCNGIIPQALFAYYCYCSDRRAYLTARESFSFLCDHLFAKGYLNIVGNRGWWRRGEKIPKFDQQPVDACSMLLACQEAYLATGDKAYRDLAQLAYQWYLGKNINKLPLYNKETGGCYDALTPEGVNLNQGAEALLSWLYSGQMMKEWQGSETAAVSTGG